MLSWLLLLILGAGPFLLAYLILVYWLCRDDFDRPCHLGCPSPRSGFYAVRLAPDDPHVGGAL